MEALLISAADTIIVNIAGTLASGCLERWSNLRITVYPVGGLGNQLFIYAAGLSKARSTSARLEVDPIHITLDRRRNLELNSFESDFSIVDRDGPTPCLMLLQKLFAVRDGRIDHRNSDRCLTPIFRYDPKFFDRSRRRLWGYFQSWQYFETVADELRDQLRGIRSKSSWFEEISAEIQNSGPSVAVHVRRGDFVGNEVLGALPESYFESALRFIMRAAKCSDVFVFSDDIESLEAKEFLSGTTATVHYVRNHELAQPIEVVNLLAKCDHIVMSNSTLSWWGAWLGSTDSQIVVYPRPWFSGRLSDERNFALPSWVSLGWRA